MDDQVTDNQTQVDGSADNNVDVTIENIMGGMSDKTEPEAKPDKAEEGTKAEGKEDQTESTEPEYPAWTQQLPEELRNDVEVMKQLAKFGKIGDVAKAYSELESKIGKSMIKPADDASEEEINAFYQKLGKPETADGYSIKTEEAKAFREIAYKNNLTETQFKSMYETFKEIGENAMNQQKYDMQKQAKTTTEELKKEYGSDFPQAMAMLQRGVNAYGGKTLGNKLRDSGLLADKDVVDMFIKLGKQTSESGSTAGSTAEGGYKSTNEGGSFKFKLD